jgi:hypothetical protein
MAHRHGVPAARPGNMTASTTPAGGTQALSWNAAGGGFQHLYWPHVGEVWYN